MSSRVERSGLSVELDRRELTERGNDDEPVRSDREDMSKEAAIVRLESGVGRDSGIGHAGPAVGLTGDVGSPVPGHRLCLGIVHSGRTGVEREEEDDCEEGDQGGSSAGGAHEDSFANGPSGRPVVRRHWHAVSNGVLCTFQFYHGARAYSTGAARE